MAGDASVSEWWSIEVFDATELPARRWRDAYEDTLIALPEPETERVLHLTEASPPEMPGRDLRVG